MYVFTINLELFSPISYTLGFFSGGVRDNLTYCVHLKKELEFLQGLSNFLLTWQECKAKEEAPHLETSLSTTKVFSSKSE